MIIFSRKIVPIQEIHRATTAVTLNSVKQDIVFLAPLPDVSYNVNIELVTSDENPSVYSSVVGNKTVNGFTVFFSGEIDTNNYIIEWEVFR